MIFIDSSYFIAVVRNQDQWHEKTRKIQSQIKNQDKITSILVLSEVLTHLGTRAGGKKGILTYEYINKDVDVVYPDKNLIDNALGHFLTYDGTLSFADALSVAIMNKYDINTIVSFDSDFDKIKGLERIH